MVHSHFQFALNAEPPQSVSAMPTSSRRILVIVNDLRERPTYEVTYTSQNLFHQQVLIKTISGKIFSHSNFIPDVIYKVAVVAVESGKRSPAVFASPNPRTPPGSESFHIMQKLILSFIMFMFVVLHVKVPLLPSLYCIYNM